MLKTKCVQLFGTQTSASSGFGNFVFTSFLVFVSRCGLFYTRMMRRKKMSKFWRSLLKINRNLPKLVSGTVCPCMSMLS